MSSMWVIWMMCWLACVHPEQAEALSQRQQFQHYCAASASTWRHYQFGPGLIRIHHPATPASHDFTHDVRSRKGQTTNMCGKQFFNFWKTIFSVCQTNMILVQQISAEIAVTIPGTWKECILEIMTCMSHGLWWRKDLSDSAPLHEWINDSEIPCIHVYYVYYMYWICAIHTVYNMIYILQYIIYVCRVNKLKQTKWRWRTSKLADANRLFPDLKDGRQPLPMLQDIVPSIGHVLPLHCMFTKLRTETLLEKSERASNGRYHAVQFHISQHRLEWLFPEDLTAVSLCTGMDSMPQRISHRSGQKHAGSYELLEIEPTCWKLNIRLWISFLGSEPASRHLLPHRRDMYARKYE